MPKKIRPAALSYSYKPDKGIDDQGQAFYDGNCKECGEHHGMLYKGIIWFGPEWLEEFFCGTCLECMYALGKESEVEVL